MTDTMDLSETVGCSVCVEDASLTRILVIENAPVCHTCVKQIFINAVEDESNYPPRWADKELKINQYQEILGPDLVSQYRKKTHEYKKKWDDRVYCPTQQEGAKCGEYLGGRRDKMVHTRLTSKCKKCSKKTCLVCKAQPTSRLGHICEPTAEEKEQEAASFKGLIKGKDYQKCPNCKRKLELWDGCNHIVCPCGTSLCFVCGQPAPSNSHHWSREEGKETCPRYNHPKDRNPAWDAAPPLPTTFPDIRAMERQNAELREQRRHARRRHERRNAVAGLPVPPFEPVSTPAVTAAGTTARQRRLGGPDLGGPDNPIDLDNPARDRQAAITQEPPRLGPPLGTDIFMDVINQNMLQDSAELDQPDLTMPFDLFDPIQPDIDGAIGEADPFTRSPPQVEGLTGRAQALAQLLSSLPPEERQDRVTITRRRTPASRRATAFQAPEIPERRSSLQPRMMRMQRGIRPARRQPSLNDDFPTPPRHDGSHGASHDSMMLD